jgi:transcription elongation factor GreA
VVEKMLELPIVKQLRDELQKVEKELRIDCPKELQEAAAHGDLSENAEYEAAKHRQSFLQARVAHLNSRITTLVSLKLDNIPRDAVGFGSRVHLEDLDSGIEVVYELVTPEEVDPRKEEGEEVTINLPTGVKEYAVTKLYTLHDLFFAKPDR